MMALWNGILLGLLLTIFIGPVFFALIQTSIEKGFYYGVLMAIGIALSDLLYVSITYLGMSQFMNTSTVNTGLGIVGGLIMLGFGFVYYFKPVTDIEVRKVKISSNIGFFRHIIKGFVLNGINPSVLVFWIGVVSMATVNYQYSGTYVTLFFAAIISTVFLTDVFKAFIAHKLRYLLTFKFMRIMNKIVGVGLVIFGLRLFYFVFEV